MDIIKSDKKLLTSILITVFYAIITLICVLHHETWVDEAQVWLLAKHLSVLKLFIHLVNEGHPSFFYLLIMPFAKLSNDIIWLKLLCFLSSCAAVFLLWQFSPFNNAVKAFITISAPFIYFFPVIARSYSIVPVLLFLLAILYPKTDKHPYLYAVTLTFLANTHAIMFAFCLILSIFFIKKYLFDKRSEKKYIISASVMIFGLLILIFQIIGTAFSNIAITYIPNEDRIGDFLRVILLFIYNSFDTYIIKFAHNYFTIYPLLMSLLTVCLYALVSFCLFKSSKKFFTLFLISAVFQIAVYVFFYSYHIFPTRIYCLYMILLFCFWVSYDIKKDEKIINLTNFALIFLFLITNINTFRSYFGDILYDYTPSKKTSEFIRKNIKSENSLLVTGSIIETGALIYYLSPEYKLYSIYDAKPLKYIVWNENGFSVLAPSQYITVFKSIRSEIKNKNLYAIVAFNPFDEQSKYILDENYFELLYITPNTIMPNEALRIYRYKK